MKFLKMRGRATTGALCLASLSLVIACGGGDDDNSDPTGTGGDGAGGGPIGSAGGAIGAGGGPIGSAGGAVGAGGDVVGAGGGPIGSAGGAVGAGGDVVGASGGAVAVGDCDFTISTSAPSPDMGSVGVVEFSSTEAGVTGATIEFGKTTDYGIVAPVDLSEPNYRTLLLGLPFNSTVNYRIVLQAGSKSCASENQTMTLNGPPNGVQAGVTVTGGDGTETADGYIVSSVYNGGIVFITNMMGELVWLKNVVLNDSSQAKLSWDGKYIYARNGNPGGMNGGQLVSVKMDGSGEETIPASTSHHDFAFLPDGKLLYVRRSETVTNCDVVVERTPEGTESVLFEVADSLPTFTKGGTADGCHTNSIRYNQHDASITLSMLTIDTILNFDLATKATNWVIGAQDPTLNMNGLTWDVQHGTFMTDSDTLYFFNNGGNSKVGDGNSVIVKASLAGGSVTVAPEFFDSSNNTMSQGDVQVLPNGNVLVTYSNPGISIEFSPSGSAVKTFKYAGGVGYANYRTSLYGPPLR